ncbi:NADH-quinone oxidoreductase subunit J [Candidatus Poribacteria bacterium]|jgi:NADH-quinone oxidoreductase subunit J|nr:NADH-quinone oxidoreductase subunit J [Candidatus Poribacteria bacterium]MBT5531942.1 NADH-quinone oxidoreductase subunit J [Candidatus Poribacteria bacterium]MBT5713488.1 NADH-quinone oxidoreductase subunit J [Candidatus Poribacteria bacterium]MBT7808671.1 NADH-quinone oxidoreductase subunit J [Candidatus Poribacteria bacterium]
METLLYLVFGLVALVGGVLVIVNRNPVYSALSLVLTMFAISALYILQQAYFVAAVQIVVYAGAIVVLFLFVIMLLNLGDESDLPASSGTRRFVGALLGVTFAGIVGAVVWEYASTAGPAVAAGTDIDHTKLLARVLFQNYLLPFEVVSLVLLAALVGVLALIRTHGRDLDSSEADNV